MNKISKINNLKNISHPSLWIHFSTTPFVKNIPQNQKLYKQIQISMNNSQNLPSFLRRSTSFNNCNEYDYQISISDEIKYPWPIQQNYNEQFVSIIQMPKTPRKKRKKQLNYEKKRVNKQKNKKINQPIPFSFYEDEAILNHVNQFGPKFHKISKLFPGRTDSMVKNRYYKTLRFQWNMFEQYPSAEIFKPAENNLDETSNFNEFNLKNFLES